MKKIRIVSCGAGNRAYGQILMLARMEEYDLVGVCDLYKDKAETIVNKVKELYNQEPPVYTDYIKMFEELKPDAVLVSTPWDTHVKISCDAMERGIAVAMEVGGAYSEEECWELFKQYAEMVGAVIEEEDENDCGPSYEIAKTIQEKIIKMVEETFGVPFPMSKDG